MNRALLCVAAIAAFATASYAFAASAPGAAASPAAPESPPTPPAAPTTNGDTSAPAAPTSGSDAAATGRMGPAEAASPAPTGIGLGIGSQIIDNQGALVGPVTAISNGADGKPVATVMLDDKTFAVPISSLLVQDGKGTINLTRAQIQAMVTRASAAPEPAAQ